MRSCARVLVASSLLGLCVAPAFAAGLAPVATEGAASVPPTVVMAPQGRVFGDWTGVYVGGQLAYGRLGYELDDGDSGEADFDGAVGGLHAGYAHDFGRVVLGAEVAYEWTDLELDDEGDASFDVGSDLEGTARAGLRVGYDAGRILPYATAGYARASFSDEVAGTGEDRADGYYFGGGVEYAVTDRFSVAGEVLRREFELDADDLNTGLTTVGVRASYRF